MMFFSKLGYYAKGTLVNTNTIEEFRNIDKNQLFQQITDKVNKIQYHCQPLIIPTWQINNDIESNEVLNNSSLLAQFLLLTFADLKKYKFYYWFAFPAFMPKPSVWITRQIETAKSYLSSSQWDTLLNQYSLVTDTNNPYFLIKKSDNELQFEKFSQLDKISFNEDQVSFKRGDNII